MKHKFNKYKVADKPSRTRDGIAFDSKKEANYYDQLKLRKRAGDVLVFLRQPKFHLPGKAVYRCDFLVFLSDGSVEFIDVKGFRTPEYQMKKRMVEEIYAPIKITEV